MQKLPPICAMFLTQFDVHTGYELKWFRSVDDETYTGKDLEFKSIPSGLHSVSSDTICFVKMKNGSETFLYGLSVFKQNNHLQQLNSSGNVDRDKVKLYSLGILIDPTHLSGLEEFTNWKPKTYSAAWKLKPSLVQLLNNFMNLKTDKQEEEYFGKFDQFFDDNCFRAKPNGSFSISDAEDVSKSSPNLKPKVSRTSVLSSLSDNDFKSDNMIDTLIPFVNDFGPLIFKIWKISLLRKAIIMYSPYQSSTICVDGNEEIKHNNFTIGDMSRFLFCISLISSIPKELENSLKESSDKDLTELLFNRPIYNVCVNDIYDLVKLDTNYLASTTDQIIIEKNNLYDYSIKLPLSTCDSNLNVPEVKNAVTNALEYATPKDLERFNILYSSINDTIEESPIASKVSDIRSIQELIWTGLAWWASAGETFTSAYDEFNIEYECFDGLSNDKIEKLITLVGYFQQLTVRLFRGLIELKNRCATESRAGSGMVMVLDAHDIQEIGLDPYSSSDCLFLVELVNVWWGIEVKIGSYFDDFCYWT